MCDLHAAVEFAGDDAHKRQGIAVVFVHACLHLEYHPGEIRFDLPKRAVYRGPTRRLGCEFAEGVEDLVHPKVQHCRGEDHRGGDAVEEEFLVVDGTVGGEEFDFFRRGVPCFAFPVCCRGGVVVFFGGDGGAAGGAHEVDIFLC